MTEFLQTLALTGSGTAIAICAAEDNINRVLRPDPSPTLSFVTSPQGAAFTYSAGTTTYTTSANITPVATAITFTATVVLPLPNVYITEYYWDFGDGHFDYGNPVTHTFTATTDHNQAFLRVTTSDGKRWFCRKQLYIR